MVWYGMVAKPHGNSKRDTTFQRLLPSTKNKLKNSVHIPKCRPKDFLDEVYCSSGNVISVRSMNELHQIDIMLNMLQKSYSFGSPSAE